MPFTVHVGKIIPQQDEYRTEAGKQIPDAAFWQDPSPPPVEVSHFKRFRVKLTVREGTNTGEAEAIISLRGHLLKVTSPKGTNVRANALLGAISQFAQKLDHAVVAKNYYHDPRNPPFLGVPRGPSATNFNRTDAAYATIADGYWLADVLKHASELPGFDEQGEPVAKTP